MAPLKNQGRGAHKQPSKARDHTVWVLEGGGVSGRSPGKKLNFSGCVKLGRCIPGEGRMAFVNSLLLIRQFQPSEYPSFSTTIVTLW